MFCATGGICLVNQSEGSFVIGWGAGRGLLAERTYEHQQHPAPFSGEYRMHSCNMAALSSRIIPERTGRRRRIEPSSVTVTAPLLSIDLHIPSEIWSEQVPQFSFPRTAEKIMWIILQLTIYKTFQRNQHSQIKNWWVDVWTNANSENTPFIFPGIEFYYHNPTSFALKMLLQASECWTDTTCSLVYFNQLIRYCVYCILELFYVYFQCFDLPGHHFIPFIVVLKSVWRHLKLQSYVKY